MSGTGRICLTFCAMALTTVAWGVRSDFLEPSISAAVRVGATVATRFLNPGPPAFFPVLFYKLTEEINKHVEISGRKGKEEENDLFVIILKLLGIDSRKITDFAFDGMISLVHLYNCQRDWCTWKVTKTTREGCSLVFVEMNQILLKDPVGGKRKEREAPRDLSLFSFIVRQQQIAEYLEQMQDPSLVDLILKGIKKKLKSYPEKDLQCTELLICKMKPFVRGMQRSLRFFLKREKRKISGGAMCKSDVYEETCRENDEFAAWEKANLEGRMYFFLPDTREVVEWGDHCDLLFQNCTY